MSLLLPLSQLAVCPRQGVHAGPPQGISHAVPTGGSNPGTGLSLWGADVGAEGWPRAGRAAEFLWPGPGWLARRFPPVLSYLEDDL